MSSSSIDNVTIDDVQRRTEEGVVFEAASIQTGILNAGAKAKWLFRTGPKRCIVYARRVTVNGDEIEYQAFKGPTVSVDGTPVTVVNRNGNSSISNTASVFEAPTTTADGDGIPPVYMPGTTGQGQQTIGQFDQEGFVRILEPNTDYLVQVTNNGANASATIEWYLMWAELNLPA